MMNEATFHGVVWFSVKNDSSGWKIKINRGWRLSTDMYKRVSGYI